jgi:hypothetical protein
MRVAGTKFLMVEDKFDIVANSYCSSESVRGECQGLVGLVGLPDLLSDRLGLLGKWERGQWGPWGPSLLSFPGSCGRNELGHSECL